MEGLTVMLLLCKGRYRALQKRRPYLFCRVGGSLRETKHSVVNVSIKEAQSKPADKKRIKYFHPLIKKFQNLMKYYLSQPIDCSY